MLRKLLNEPKRNDQGELLNAFRAINDYRSKLQRLGPRGRGSDQNGKLSLSRLDLWAQGFIDAINELEESLHCAKVFVRGIHSPYVEDMDTEEQDQYRRHIYFYKNAFIRVFSILDKLGYFLNDLYGLNTERVKARFSYFTVLRQMHERKIEVQLEQKLFHLKNEYDDALRRLRTQRNMEIHLLNAELVEDMVRANHSLLTEDRQKVENLKQNLSDLEKSFQMVCLAIETVFLHAKRSAHA